MATLQVEARVEGRLDVRFTVAAGEVLAVLGPNGAGKSTLAEVVAGLTRPDSALVTVGDRVLTDTAAGVAVPVWDRRVGLLLQEPMLFPHLTALDNVAFAARCRAPRTSRGASGVAARNWLAEVGAGELARRRPAALSGGQAQRVALARALAAAPEVLLLDEPLAGLDVAAAVSVRGVLRRALADGDRPAILITHDLADVIAIADRVLILEDGRIAETGPAAAVLAAPRSRFGARIAGVNVVAGVVAAEPGESLPGRERPLALRSAAGETWHGLPAAPLAAGDPAVAVFSPAAVAIYRQRPYGSPRNVVSGAVAGFEATSTTVRVRLTEQADGSPGLAADVTVGAVVDLALEVGEQVWFTVKTQAVALYPASQETPRHA